MGDMQLYYVIRNNEKDVYKIIAEDKKQALIMAKNCDGKEEDSYICHVMSQDNEKFKIEIIQKQDVKNVINYCYKLNELKNKISDLEIKAQSLDEQIAEEKEEINRRKKEIEDLENDKDL